MKIGGIFSAKQPREDGPRLRATRAMYKNGGGNNNQPERELCSALTWGDVVCEYHVLDGVIE